MVGGFVPPRLNSAASASSGRVRGVVAWFAGAAGLRQTHDLRPKSRAPAVIEVRRPRTLLKGRSRLPLLAGVKRQSGRAGRAEEGKGLFSPEVGPTRGCKTPEARAHCGASPPGGARGRPQRAPPPPTPALRGSQPGSRGSARVLCPWIASLYSHVGEGCLAPTSLCSLPSFRYLFPNRRSRKGPCIP